MKQFSMVVWETCDCCGAPRPSFGGSGGSEGLPERWYRVLSGEVFRVSTEQAAGTSFGRGLCCGGSDEARS